MARTVRDTKMETRNARLALPARHEPHWKSIDEGMHIGYRKGPQKTSWLARYRSETGAYKKTVLGLSDDIQDADGVNVFSFSQAQEAARKWFSLQGQVEAGLGYAPTKGRYTIAMVMDEYLAWFKVHRKGLSQIQYSINAHIKPSLGHIEAAKLTPAKLRGFHEKLAATPARLRTAPGQSQNYKADLKHPDAIRQRKTTANKILTILKAALNRAYADGRIASDEAWRRVKPFRGVDLPKVRYLSQEECQNLVNVCDPHFRSLVQGAILTGARYGELTAMKTQDYNPDSGTVFVESSKNGKVRHVVLTDEAQEFFASLIAEKRSDDLIFAKKDGSKWGRTHQFRPLRDACEKAEIEPAISFHILRHTHASQLAMAGTPLTVIAAQLGHSDTRMTEKHYAHLASSYVSETIRANFPKLGLLN